jgi:protein PhnA
VQIDRAAKVRSIDKIGNKMAVKDSNGTELDSGDSVQVIKDLKVKGTSSTIKRGTTYKNIRLTSKDEEIECGKGKSTVVLKTCFLKKV